MSRSSPTTAVGPERGVHLFDPDNDIPDASGHRLAGPLGLVAQPAGSPPSPAAAAKLAHQRVPLLAASGGPLRVGPALGLLDVLVEGGQPVPDLRRAVSSA